VAKRAGLLEVRQDEADQLLDCNRRVLSPQLLSGRRHAPEKKEAFRRDA